MGARQTSEADGVQMRRISAMCQGELQAAPALIAEGESPQGQGNYERSKKNDKND